MTLHVHRLDGCRPEPLSHYLKALGVLRLVSRQADPAARGFWRDDVFHLVCTLDRWTLEAFFLERYSPTPLIGPWNGGSGFYEGDSIDGREALRNSTDARFAAYRQAINAVLAWPELPATGLSVGALLDRVRAMAAQKKGKTRDTLLELVSAVEARLPAEADPERGRLLGSTIAAKKKGLDKRVADELRGLRDAARKVRTQFKSDERSTGKEGMALAARSQLSDDAIGWLDAAVLITRDGDLKWPPLLGSGGNEGRFDYTNAFADAITAVAVKPDVQSHEWLRAALWCTPASGLRVASIGQFDPGRAGGFNQGPGMKTKNVPTNPWNLALCLEGAIIWSSSLSKTGRVEAATGLSSPFTVIFKAVGFSSTAASDETTGKDGNNRGEVWAPLWAQPTRLSELTSLVAESRAQVARVGPKRNLQGKTAHDTTEFAEAASTLGVARGISEFVRYSLVKRRGDSFLALPAGRFRPPEDRSYADLIRELAGLLSDVDSFIRGFGDLGPPAALGSARRNVDAAIFEALERPSAAALQAVLATLGELEQFFAQRDRSKTPKLIRPLQGLSPRWIRKADDGSPELRIATALASIQATGPVGSPVGPFRANLTGIDAARPWDWTKSHGQVAWHGSSVTQRLVSVLARRLVDGERLGSRKNPLYGRVQLDLRDILAFVAGDVDDAQIERLVFGLSLVQWTQDPDHGLVRKLNAEWSGRGLERPVPGPWALLKLLFLSDAVPVENGEDVHVRAEPSVLSLLLGRRLDAACDVAQRRLRGSGLDPVGIAWAGDSGLDPIRVAASLLIPCNAHSQQTLTRQVLSTPVKKEGADHV
jgi:CRISPR-associated protein Csx17